MVYLGIGVGVLCVLQLANLVVLATLMRRLPQLPAAVPREGKTPWKNT